MFMKKKITHIQKFSMSITVMSNSYIFLPIDNGNE